MDSYGFSYVHSYSYVYVYLGISAHFELNAQRSLKVPFRGGGWVLIKKKFFKVKREEESPLVTIQLGGYAQIEIEIEIDIEIDIGIGKSVELKMLLQDG